MQARAYICLLGASVLGCAIGFAGSPASPPDGGEDTAPDPGVEPDVPADTVEEEVEDARDEDPVVEEEVVDPFEPLEHVAGDLEDVVAALPMTSDPSVFQLPGATRRSSWVGLVSLLLVGSYASALAEASSLMLGLRVVDDVVSGRPYILVWDENRGEGIYVLDPDPVNDLVVEVPYPLGDAGTLGQGVAVLREASG
jgi:hypothetical protein